MSAITITCHVSAITVSSYWPSSFCSERRGLEERVEWDLNYLGIQGTGVRAHFSKGHEDLVKYT